MGEEEKAFVTAAIKIRIEKEKKESDKIKTKPCRR